MCPPESPPPSLASRHGEDAGAEPAPLPGFDNLFQVTSHEGYDPDAVGGDKSVHGPRNGAAHQGADSEFNEPEGLLNHQLLENPFLRLGDDPPGPGLDHANPTGRVKNRGDAMIPVGKCRFHFSLPGLPLLLYIAKTVPRGHVDDSVTHLLDYIRNNTSEGRRAKHLTVAFMHLYI